MLSLSAMSVIASEAFWAAERRGLEAMLFGDVMEKSLHVLKR